VLLWRRGGIHVLEEKPLALTIADASDLVARLGGNAGYML